ncbi:MAG: hypothetical protein AAF401_03855 [Pseudomonadota bacterium]
MLKRTAAACIAGAAMTLLLAEGARSDIVVLESTVASIEPGSIIAEEATLELPAGASLMLISEQGETRIVTGPYSGPAGDARANGDESLFATRGRETKVLGAVRAPKWEFDG